jgi:hypothetical protein
MKFRGVVFAALNLLLLGVLNVSASAAFAAPLVGPNCS